MRELRNDLAICQKKNVELRDEITFLKGELKGTAFRQRDSTTDKINLAMERRFAMMVWYRERILAPSLAQVHTIIILAILYLAFGGKLP